ncbi:unnamed protein product [Paramecium octaurelia]|uniref:Uncharacterized protein n=1 Tax=Paramecium octaurelia TaxID=43137 RepID=A0A8S1TSW9_PAROT|nr:unnamed protein product [Paramecium octaurelia]
MTEKSSQKFSKFAGNRLRMVYKAIPHVSSMEKQVQIENQRTGYNPSKQNEDLFNNYQILLQQIEDLLEKNFEKYKNSIISNADKLLNGYEKLKWLMNIAFEKQQLELSKWFNQERNKEQQNNQKLENQQKKNLQDISKKHEEEIASKLEEIRILNQTIREQAQKQQEIIQQKENRINRMEDEIGCLKANQEALQQQILKKDNIFQEVIKEAKNKSFEVLEKLNLQNELPNIKIQDEKLKPILQQEEEIRLQIKILSGMVDEVLIMKLQNSQDEQNQEKIEQIEKRFLNLKQQITAVIKFSESCIYKQKQIWGSAKQFDSLNQQVKPILQFMNIFSKLFEKMYQTFQQILERMGQYLKESKGNQIQKYNGSLSTNLSSFIQHIYPQKETQRFYAAIETQSNDTISRKESQSQTEFDDSQSLDENQQITPQQSSSPKKKNGKKPCQKQTQKSNFSKKGRM